MHMIDFIDDKRHYVNSFNKNSKAFLIQAIEKSVNIWYELFHVIGGGLEIDKCEWHHISWDFDKNDKPFMK